MADIDAILDELGIVTRPILIQLVIVTLPAILVSHHMTAMVFLGYHQDHTCTMPHKENIIQKCKIDWTELETSKYIPWDNTTQQFDSCSRYKYDFINCTFWASNDTFLAANIDNCNSWSYDTSQFETTVVGDFNLVCDNKQKGRLSQAIFMLGVTVGVAVWGQLSDRFGRRMAIILPMSIGVAVGIGTAFSQSFVVFTILRFVIGFTFFASLTSGYVLATETVKQEHKVWYTQIFEAIFGFGICTLCGIAYFERDWRKLQIWITAPGVVLLLLQCLTVESPRWLLSKMKYSQANEVIQKLMTSKKYHQSQEAKKLRKLSRLHEGEKIPKEMKELGKDNDTSAEIHKAENDTLIDILKLPNMRRRTFVFCYIWMVISALYYGLTLNSAELGGNVFVNLFLSAVVEIPAAFLGVPMIKVWGRRPTLTSMLILGGTVCICMMFVSKELIWLNVLLSTIGKFSISIAFGAVYVYSIDIYPTPVRNVGLGVCSSWARIGGMLAPFIAMLDVIGFAVPYVAFGLMAVLAGILGLLLPETLGKKIPETLKKAERFGENYEGVVAFLCTGKHRSSLVQESLVDEETRA